MSLGEFRQHLVEVHGVGEAQGTRRLSYHIDYNDHYVSGYDWDIQGVTATQTIVRPRRDGWPT